MPMKKTKGFICFQMLEEGKKFLILFFSCFQVENKVTSMYKIFYLQPKYIEFKFLNLVQICWIQIQLDLDSIEEKMGYKLVHEGIENLLVIVMLGKNLWKYTHPKGYFFILF
jgi:hypothetical protein